MPTNGPASNQLSRPTDLSTLDSSLFTSFVVIEQVGQGWKLKRHVPTRCAGGHLARCGRMRRRPRDSLQWKTRRRNQGRESGQELERRHHAILRPRARILGFVGDPPLRESPKAVERECGTRAV